MNQTSKKLVLTATPEEEDFAGKYTEQSNIAQYMVRQYFLAVANLYSNIKGEVNTALELGCGEGFSTSKLSAMLGQDIKFEASEYVDDLVSLARDRNPEIDIVQENIYELNRASESFDLVFLLEVLEHLDYPELALEQISNISSKYLILGVPREPLWRILNCARGKYWSSLGNTPGHLNHWSSRSLIRFIEKHYGQVLALESPLPWTIVLAKKRNSN